MKDLNLKKIKPMGSNLLTTAYKYEPDKKIAGSSLIDATKKDGLMNYQTVVAVGPFVRDIKVGDLVCINPRAYAVHKQVENSLKSDLQTQRYDDVVRYFFNMITLDGVDHVMFTDRDIEYIVEEYEEVQEVPTPTPSGIIVPKTNLILPN